jgi:hypothetical protein
MRPKREDANSYAFILAALSFEERSALLWKVNGCPARTRFQRLVRQAAFRFPALIEDIDYSGKNGVSKPEVLKLGLGGCLKKP